MPTRSSDNRQSHNIVSCDNEQQGVSRSVDLLEVSPADLETGLNAVVDDLNKALDSLERAKVVSQEALEFEVSI